MQTYYKIELGGRYIKTEVCVLYCDCAQTCSRVFVAPHAC
jgi:hypothetical protein